MKSKYHMSKKENIFLAQRNIVDYIWKSANLEGIGITYPDTLSAIRQFLYDNCIDGMIFS